RRAVSPCRRGRRPVRRVLGARRRGDEAEAADDRASADVVQRPLMARGWLVLVVSLAAIVSASCTSKREAQLRTEFQNWKFVPSADNGTARDGIGTAGLVQAIYKGALGVDIPATRDEQIQAGKLVDRGDLAPGDLVFFDGDGIGPFRQHWVGLF